MSLRSGHGNGNGAGVPRVEALPAGELPEGVPAPARGESPNDRGEGGRFAAGAGTRGRGWPSEGRPEPPSDPLGETFADPRFEPYATHARAFRRAQVTRLAQTVGGGECGPAPSSGSPARRSAGPRAVRPRGHAPARPTR